MKRILALTLLALLAMAVPADSDVKFRADRGQAMGLTDELRDASRDAFTGIELYAHHGSRLEARARARLRDLMMQSRRYAYVADRAGIGSNESGIAFAALLQSYCAAADDLYTMGTYGAYGAGSRRNRGPAFLGPTYGQFNRVSQVMDQLMPVYGYPSCGAHSRTPFAGRVSPRY